MTAAESVRHTPCLARRDAPRIQYGRYIAADTHLRCAGCLPFQSAGGLKAALQKGGSPPSGGDRLKDSVAFYERKPFRIRKLAGQNTTMQFGFPMCQMFLLVVPYFLPPIQG